MLYTCIVRVCCLLHKSVHYQILLYECVLHLPSRAGHSAKSEDLRGDRTLRELRRQYHCHAYNMLMAVISCTQTKPQFFQGFLFKEDLQKGTILWDNIIDAEKTYSFTAELEVL